MPLDPSTPRLDGKAAVVTGAAAGIGRATALALARFGADVALCDRNGDDLATAAKEIEAGGGRARAEVLDVREPDAVDAFCRATGEQFGGIDVLVNNAGGGFHAAFVDVNAKGQSALIRENFDSVTNFLRAALPFMGDGGSIVNVTSIEAHRAAPGYAIYSAQKAAVANLTKSLALELGQRGIRINCVAPDVIPTPGIGELPDPPRTPLARRGDPDDVAAAIVFLAGDMARFVTGTTIHVDGGNLAAGGWRRLDDGSYGT